MMNLSENARVLVVDATDRAFVNRRGTITRVLGELVRVQIDGGGAHIFRVDQVRAS